MIITRKIKQSSSALVHCMKEEHLTNTDCHNGVRKTASEETPSSV